MKTDKHTEAPFFFFPSARFFGGFVSNARKQDNV